MGEKIQLSYDEADDIICFIRNHEREDIPDAVWDVCMRMYEELYG